MYRVNYGNHQVSPTYPTRGAADREQRADMEWSAAHRQAGPAPWVERRADGEWTRA